MFQKLYGNVIPNVCCLCDNTGAQGIDLCEKCQNDLPRNRICCLTCAAPLNIRLSKSSYRCGRCIRGRQLIERATIPFLYGSPVDFMIKRLKFSGETKYGRVLGELLANAIPTNRAVFPSRIIPVPIHNARLKDRGFNQAETIGKTVADRLGIPIERSVLSRTISKLPQSSLSARQREENIRRAFQVVDGDRIKNQHVALVDDVYTTGATVNAIAAKLRAAGVAKISLWIVARTP